jgi:hypothetical protein
LIGLQCRKMFAARIDADQGCQFNFRGPVLRKIGL